MKVKLTIRGRKAKEIKAVKIDGRESFKVGGTWRTYQPGEALATVRKVIREVIPNFHHLDTAIISLIHAGYDDEAIFTKTNAAFGLEGDDLKARIRLIRQSVGR